MTKKDTTQRSYMALAPLSSLAGIFINPLASTITPLILFFIFRNNRPEVGKTALQTADLAFSMTLWKMLIDLTIFLGISLDLISSNDAQFINFLSTWIILGLFTVSLLFAVYQALNGRTCQHFFSFKIAERVFNLVNGRSHSDSGEKPEK